MHDQPKDSWNSGFFKVEMAAKATSFLRGQRNARGFMTVLNSAACEWILIILLLIDGVLSYILTKFAHYCKLQIPCILCSRLDHVLGKERPGFYRNLLCSSHRSEISSLISCHLHGKLADGCGMCEECLLSFTTKATSNPATERLLLGKLGCDLGGCSSQGSLMSRKFLPGSLAAKLCSCCNKPWRSRPTDPRIMQLKQQRIGMTKPNVPLPRRLTHREGMKKFRERFAGSCPSLGKAGYDPLCHVGYTELKISSDSESEFTFSDDDDVINIVREIKEPKEECKHQYASEVLPGTPFNDVSSQKHADQSSNPGSDEPHDVKCLVPDSDSGHEQKELNWQQAKQKTHPSAQPELISLDDFPPLSNIMEASAGVSTEKYELKFPVSQRSGSSALSDLMSLTDGPSSVKVSEGPVEESHNKSDGAGEGNAGNDSINSNKEMLKPMSAIGGANIKSDRVANKVPPINQTHIDLNDELKPIASSKEKMASGFTGEISTTKETKSVKEDPELLREENASPREIELPSNSTILDTQGHGDKLQTGDASSSNVVHMPQDSSLVEKTESSVPQSLEGSLDPEIEGESLVDQLKQQVEHDRKCISDLYAELEEERSASAIAANQAMAMITRLQEEKAALNMEALQYLRMMEEQAEYDVDALEKANDLLAEREKEIQDLEAELDFFRIKYPDESALNSVPEKNMTLDNAGAGYSKDNVNIPPSSISREVLTGSEKSVIVKSSWSDYEDERLYISECLKGLERKLSQFVRHSTSRDMLESEHSEETADRGHYVGETNTKEASQNSGEMTDYSWLVQKDQSVVTRSLRVPAHNRSYSLVGNLQNIGEKSNLPDSSGEKPSKQHTETDLVTLENEISDLNERLEALETDRNFLEHTLNFLHAGNEGLQFVQEIAQQLQELRKIGIRSNSQSLHSLAFS